MAKIKLEHNGGNYTFRKMSVDDLAWLNAAYATKTASDGLSNFKAAITDFEQMEVLCAALYKVMFRLCEDKNVKDINEFAFKFGTGLEDVAVLYKTLNEIVGNTSKMFKAYEGTAQENLKLKKENRKLKYHLALEKGKNLKNLVKSWF